jgi:hypothetical protein
VKRTRKDQLFIIVLNFTKVFSLFRRLGWCGVNVAELDLDTYVGSSPGMRSFRYPGSTLETTGSFSKE